MALGKAACSATGDGGDDPDHDPPHDGLVHSTLSPTKSLCRSSHRFAQAIPAQTEADESGEEEESEHDELVDPNPTCSNANVVHGGSPKTDVLPHEEVSTPSPPRGPSFA